MSFTGSLPFAQSTTAADFELSSSQYLSIADASQTGLDLSTDFTFEAWIRLEQLPSTAGATFTILAKDDVGVSRSYFFGIESALNKLKCNFFSDNTTRTDFVMDEAFDAGDLGVWIHVAAVADISASSIIFYKNGVLMAGTTVIASSTTIQNGTAPFTVGGRLSSSSPEAFFDGQLDEVRVWNDIRTGTEIANNYQIELVGNEANLVAYYAFEAIPSPSVSPSSSASLSVSPSSSTSLSVSPSSSVSPSVSPSSSESASASETPSPSVSPSVSPSISPSISASISPSASVSPSSSVSASVSPSSSVSASISPSASVSPSASTSPSLSPSASASPSPTEYVEKYSLRGTSYGNKYTTRNTAYNNKYSARGTTYTEKYE